MNIAFFCEFYPSTRNPIGGSFFHNFAKGLVRIGHRVWVFKFKDLSWNEARALRSLYVNEEEIRDGVVIVTCYIPKIPKLTRLNRWRLFRRAKNLFARYHDSVGFQIVHVHFSEMFNSTLGVRLAKRHRLPVVCTEQSTGFLLENERETTLRAAKEVLQGIHGLTVVSEELRKVLSPHVRCPIHLVNNGVDPQMFFESANRPRSRRLVSVGFLLKKKNFHGLIEAFARVKEEYPDLTLDIVGGGPEKANLESLIAQRKLEGSVRLLGSQSNEEVAALLREYDSFVLPSVVETFGVVVLEALFSGLPVLVTRCGGPERFVRDGVDGIVTAPDPDSLTAGLRRLLSQNWVIDRDYLLRNYSIEAVAQSLDALYHTLGSTFAA